MNRLDANRLAERLETDGTLDVATDAFQLHIDRHLPFMVLYREPADGDAGTRAFVEGEASYLAANAGAPVDDIRAVVCAVAEVEKRRFGAFLLMELWAGEPLRGDRMLFRIHAPTHGAPDQMLESLETSLLSTTATEPQPADVVVDYLDTWSPTGLPPIEVSAPCCHLGLEIPAHHLDPESGELRPLAHRDLHREVVRALRRGLHEFTHAHTPLRPAHFHELGPHALDDAVREVDRDIAAISEAFDLVVHVTPVNAAAARGEFEASRRDGNPEFLYRARTLDPDLMKRRLFNIPIERIDDPAMAHLFYEKREELDRKLNLIADRNTDRFLLGSRAIYGDPDAELLAMATTILDRVDPAEAPAALPVSQLVAAAEVEIERYREIDPSLRATVELRRDLPGVMVSAGNLLIGASSSVSEQRTRALFAHEVGVHVLTHHNGRQQPFQELQVGTAGYEALQEGLAVLWEFLVGGLDGQRLRLLAGRVVAADLIADGAEFVDTHRTLAETWGFASAEAFNIAMRIHRGGGFVKDVVYLRGLMQVLDHLGSGGSFERLHIGKVAHAHLGILEELHWRQVVEPPRLLPRHLDDVEVQARLDRCRRGLGIDDLIGSIT